MQRDNNQDSLLIREGADPIAKAVLVKFTFNNRNWVPKGIRFKDRKNDASMDEFHSRQQFTVENPDLAEIGRHRPLRVDTGIPVVNNAHEIHAGIIRRALRNNGFALVDLHFFEKQEENKPSKFVVVADFKPVSPKTLAKIPALSETTTEALRALANTTWNFGHVWSNPNGFVTVNFVGRMPNQAPKRSILIRDGAIEVGLVTAILPEEEEHELAMNAAYELWHGADMNPHIKDTNLVAEKVEEAVDRAETYPQP